MRTLITLAIAAFVVTGCSDPSSTTDAATNAAPPSAPPPTSQPSTPPANQPAGPGGFSMPPVEGTVSAVTFVTQEGWTEQEPNGMGRVAQYTLPAAEGDELDGLLYASYFGPQGAGPAAMNLERWCRQFRVPGVEDPVEAATITREDIAGMESMQVEIGGRFNTENPPGSGNWVDMAGYRMLAAIVDTPDGPIYVKCLGPDATIERWRASYQAFLDGLSG